MIKYYDEVAKKDDNEASYENPYEYRFFEDAEELNEHKNIRMKTINNTIYAPNKNSLKKSSTLNKRNAPSSYNKKNMLDNSIKERKSYENEYHSIVNNDINRAELRKKKIEKRKNINRVIEAIICFAMLMLISYRYATIDANFREKENLKKELASIQKENEQLKVNIEKQMNLNAIEQEAKEKLGMQKLDNNQKVYVNLNKSDYIESAVNSKYTSDDNEKEENWWSKLLKDLFKIDK